MAEAQIFLNGNLIIHSYYNMPDLVPNMEDLSPAEQRAALVDHLYEYTRQEGFNAMGPCLVRARLDEDSDLVELDLSEFQALVVHL